MRDRPPLGGHARATLRWAFAPPRPVTPQTANVCCLRKPYYQKEQRLPWGKEGGDWGGKLHGAAHGVSPPNICHKCVSRTSRELMRSN
jgi:hypothetical protein